MRLRFVSFLIAACASQTTGAVAEGRPSLAAHAASVVSYVPVTKGRRGCQSSGSALGLGRGLVVTAAHVLLGPTDLAGACDLGPDVAADIAKSAAPFRLDVRVGRDSDAVPGQLVARGTRSRTQQMSFRGSKDYAILRASGSAEAATPLEPCPAAPKMGQHVVVLLPNGAVKAAIAVVQTTKGADDEGYIDLDRVFENGSSGSGVLDPASRCVFGVVSHRFPEPRPTVTRMTPVHLFVEAWRKAARD